MKTTIEWKSVEEERPAHGMCVHGIIYTSNHYTQTELVYDERGDWFMYYQNGVDLLDPKDRVVAWANFSDVSEVINYIEDLV